MHPRLLDILRGLSLTNISNAVIGFAFAASGPIAIILAAGAKGRLTEAELASWIFGALLGNGVLSILFSARYRQPLVFFWTIPGTVIVGPVLASSSLPEVVGAYIVAGMLMLALGLTGLVGRVMSAIPLPIVMAMVAGVFLPFGIDWLKALAADPLISVPMTMAFLAFSALPPRFAVVPPLLAALFVGIATLFAVPGALDRMPMTMALAAPQLLAPVFSLPTLIELVVPLVITVLVVQNGQGAAVLRQAGHAAPVNAIAVACGVWSALLGFVGTVSTCLTGPVNAILASSRDKATQYVAAMLVGLLAIGFGLFAPTFTKAMLAAPPAFIATLAGLAMLRVLQTAFVTAFAGHYTLGALGAFLVTVAGIPILNIGAPFWGLVAGGGLSFALEREQRERGSGRPD